jgi:hypothetical protein
MKDITDYGLTPKDAIEYNKTIPEVNYLYQHEQGFVGYKEELTAAEQEAIGATLIWSKQQEQ